MKIKSTIAEALNPVSENSYLGLFALSCLQDVETTLST